MNLITKIFHKSDNKPQQQQPQQQAKKQGRPFTVQKPNLDELYSCSVQKTVKDFDVRAINLNDGSVLNVAMDSTCDFKSIENVYRANMAGQEIIFTYYAKQGFIGFNNCAIIAQDWLVNKAIALPCYDAIAIDYDVNVCDDEISDEDQNIIAQLRKLSNNNKFKIKEICKHFAENKRKFGQALCIPLIEGVDYSVPFNIDVITSKSYKGMTVIEPQWVSPVLDIEASTDPTSTRFYKPTWFKLPNGDLIHYTWFIFNTYGEPSDILKPSYYFGGYPLPQMLYEYVYAAHKTAKEAPMLAQSKRLNYIEGNVNAYLGDEERLNREINLVSWLRNNWGWLLVKKDQRIGQLDTSLTDFDAVTMLGYQIVAAISGVQSARLLETSPKGWQSSGSLEDKNYSKTLQAIQRLDYTAILEFHYQLLAKSEFNIDKEYTVTFDEIDTPTEKERAEIREINARTDSTYINAGVVSAEEIRGVLREDEKSGYNALSEEMEGEGLPEEGDPFGDFEGGSENTQDPFSMDEWKESEHPRKKNGQFGKGGSTSGIEKSSKRAKIDSSKHPTVELPKEEYAQVMHELNTNLTNEQKKEKILRRYIGNHRYIIENNGFNEYRIIGKNDIE